MSEKKSKYIDGIGWRYETEHNMSRRMQEHDYQSRCIYMLTLALADRSQPLLGCLCLDAQGEAMLSPSELGKAVVREWYNLEKEFPQLCILRVQLMEEHLHVVVFVKENLPKHLGKLVGIVKNRSNKHYWQELTAQGRLAPKGQQTPPPLFAENFQDTILTHGGQLEAMLHYVDDNPRRAMTKRQNPKLFKVVRELKVRTMQPSCIEPNPPGCLEPNPPGSAQPPSPAGAPLPSPPSAQPPQPPSVSGVCELGSLTFSEAPPPAGAPLPPPPSAQPPQPASVSGVSELGSLTFSEVPSPASAPLPPPPSAQPPQPPGVSGVRELGSLTFAAIGNQWLLERGVRMQVRCHNNTTSANLQLIERQKEYFLERGKKGAVVVSPCISAGEKEIARAALDAKQPLIVILENGFSPLFKPAGKYFDACAEGLLLMLAPWPYHMEKRTITRQQCLALNDMAAAISNEPWTQELEQALSKK